MKDVHGGLKHQALIEVLLLTITFKKQARPKLGHKSLLGGGMRYPLALSFIFFLPVKELYRESMAQRTWGLNNQKC